MKRIIFFIMMVIASAHAQKGDNIIKQVYELANPYNLSYTILAIAKVESNLGDYPINLSDPSCGLTHINIKTYMNRHDVKDTPFNRNKVCTDLINSKELAIANAVEEILYWQSVYCKNNSCNASQWMNVWSSYNCGWNNATPKCLAYAKKIQKQVKYYQDINVFQYVKNKKEKNK